LLGRIIRACSNPGDWVLDPFSGSATTVAVAKKLDRRFISFELSPEYAAAGRARLEKITVGDPLDGPADPRRSAPSTDEVQQRSKQGRSARRSKSIDEQQLDMFPTTADDHSASNGTG